MANLKHFIQRLAKHSYQKHLFIQEWQTFIFITIVLKLAAMVFSIFAGYFYFNQLFISIMNSLFWAKVFTIITLVIVEILTAISLSKFFKFALRVELKTAIPILFLSALFFSVSFISSTNGLALRQSKKVDNTGIITEHFELKKANINLLHDESKAGIKEQIAVLKQNPQGWQGGKRTILLSEQLNSINDYYADLKDIENARKADLNEAFAIMQNDLQMNNNTRNKESSKYYKIVSFIMVLIFLVNGLLMYFYSKVFAENNKDIQSIEVIQNFSSDIQGKATSLIEKQIYDTFSLYFSAIQNNFEQINKPLKVKQSIGFNLNNDEVAPDNDEVAPDNDEVAPDNDEVAPDNDNNKRTYARNNSKYGTGICPQCKNEFIKNSYNHKFCSELHRIEFAEIKTGKNLARYKNLHKLS